jgi:hypothetical protein
VIGLAPRTTKPTKTGQPDTELGSPEVSEFDATKPEPDTPQQLDSKQPPFVRFVRDGIVVTRSGDIELHSDEGRVPLVPLGVDPKRQWFRVDWEPLEQYRVILDGQEHPCRAPLLPEPFRVHTIPLEDVRHVAAAGAAPDAVVRFSPTGQWLAVGSFGGYLRVIDCRSGRIVHRRRLAEGMVKRLAWSPDGGLLYVAEQSPDARLTAIRISGPDAEPRNSPDVPQESDVTVRTEWELRAADQLGHGVLTPGDRYGIYALPAIYDLHVADDGRLFYAGVHRRGTGPNPLSRCLIQCLVPDGTRLWQFPPEGTSDAALAHLAVDPRGKYVLAVAGPALDLSDQTSTKREPSSDPLRTGTLYLLSGEDGRILAQYAIEPLRPHFQRVESWDSLTLNRDGSRAAIGLGDGRVLLFDTAEGELKPIETFDLGAPIRVGRIPLAAHASYTRFFGPELFMQTQNTHIPFGSPQAAHQAPSIHHGANTMTVATWDGKGVWRYRGPYSLGGQWASHGGSAATGDLRAGTLGPRWLVVPSRERSGNIQPGNSQLGNFGCLLFDLYRTGSGRQRLVYHYPTEGPVIFDADISHDGRYIAVVEVPAPTPDGHDTYGSYQVHLVH